MAQPSCSFVTGATPSGPNGSCLAGSSQEIYDIIHHPDAVMPDKIGLGTYLIPRDQVASTLRYAILEAGYRRIDCAPVYFNEDVIGDTLAELFATTNIQRSDLYIVSKLPSPFHRNVKEAVRKTLNDLRLDSLDLYLSK
jgi:diketogulonate reductase-like aldo/keto reductase